MRAPLLSTSLADRGATSTMKTAAGRIAAPASDVVAEDVLQELLADEHRPHERAEDDDACTGRHPERAATGDVEVVERVGRPLLAQ